MMVRSNRAMAHSRLRSWCGAMLVQVLVDLRNLTLSHLLEDRPCQDDDDEQQGEEAAVEVGEDEGATSAKARARRNSRKARRRRKGRRLLGGGCETGDSETLQRTMLVGAAGGGGSDAEAGKGFNLAGALEGRGVLAVHHAVLRGVLCWWWSECRMCSTGGIG